jgi:hypothetical protein
MIAALEPTNQVSGAAGLVYIRSDFLEYERRAVEVRARIITYVPLRQSYRYLKYQKRKNADGLFCVHVVVSPYYGY